MDQPDLIAALDLLSSSLPEESAVAYVRDGEGALLRTAGDLRRLLGREPAELAEAPGGWWSAVHDADRDAARAKVGRLAPGGSLVAEYRIVRPSGGETWVRDVMTGLAPDQGGGTLGTLVNVSLERSFRAQIAALEDRIWESQRLESLGALSGSVAHDFNNLLTTILSSAQLLEGQVGTLAREARRDLHLIQDAARRGAALVRQILHFASRRAREVREVDVNATIADLGPILRRRIGPEARLDLALAEALPLTTADEAELEQVLLNLVVNAREASPDGGTIWVETSVDRVEEPLPVEADAEPLPPGTYVRVTVRDHGPGIPEETRARIFEPFFSTKRSRGGSGLGLSTVQRIVRAQGGGIRLETALGRGATFHVYLPARPVLAPAEVRAAALSDPLDGFRVLVVENDESVRSLLERLLHRDGHAVIAVASSGEAVRAFDRARPVFDLVVVDVELDSRSGPEVVGALRRRTPHLAVLYVSGYDRDAAVRLGVEEDAVYLAKPFSPTDLRDAVDRALEAVARRGADGRGQAHA